MTINMNKSTQEVYGPVRVIELYRALSREPAEDSFIVGRLEREGLIVKRSDSVRYQLTKTGREGLVMSLAAMLADACTRPDSGEYDRLSEEALRKLLLQAVSG